MTAMEKIELNRPVRPGGASPAATPGDGVPEDKAMLRAAVDLTRDLAVARGGIYWPDFLLSAGLGYAALIGAMLADRLVLALACAVIAVLALYRAAAFIHELTHIRAGALPGFRFAWNLLIGIPLLIPSFMYEEVHTHHHAKMRYGTIADPEYLPLAQMRPWTLPLFILAALVAPALLLVRFAVLTPLGLVIAPLRRRIVERYSGLEINMAYRRRPPQGALARMWRWQEAAACLWAIGLLVASALHGWRPLLIGMAVFAGVAVINQMRTLVAHLWENDGETMSVTAQYLDSVNVPPPALLAPLWAPVGLRYHALHHLLPSMPYHALGAAHRRLAAQMGANSTYGRANHDGMIPLIARIARRSMGGR